jgi:hypothetical protein
VPVAVDAEVVHLIVVSAVVSDLRRNHQESVLVVVDRIGLAVDIKDVSDLRSETRYRKILAIEIGDKDVVFAQRFSEIVEPAVGVLVEQAKVGEVVLPAIGIAVAEKADAELIVLKQKAAKVDVERLNADAHRIEVVIFRYVA